MRGRLAHAGQVVLWATLAAGAVGVLRQRREAVLVRRGALPAASASAALPGPAREGRAAARLAAWVPPAPRSTAGRLLAAAWAGPLTVVGFGVALLSGRRPRWSATWGCFVAESVGGVSAAALRSVGAEANTIGQVVLSRRSPLPTTLLAHEVVHVRQAERLGPLLLPAYLWLGARYGYRHHPLERAARLGAGRVAGSLGGPPPAG